MLIFSPINFCTKWLEYGLSTSYFLQNETIHLLVVVVKYKHLPSSGGDIGSLITLESPCVNIFHYVEFMSYMTGDAEVLLGYLYVHSIPKFETGFRRGHFLVTNDFNTSYGAL